MGLITDNVKLLSWAFGDFEYVEAFTKRKYNGEPLPVRVYTTRGLKEQARFGLENACQIVDYYSEVGHRDERKLLELTNQTSIDFWY